MAIKTYDPDEIHKEDLGHVTPNISPQISPAKAAPTLGNLKARLEGMKVLPAGAKGDDYDIDEKALKALPQKDIKLLQTHLSEAKIYVPEDNQYYADGKLGGLTTHGLKLVASEKYAERHITEDALRDKKLDKTEIMKLQASLNRLGFDAGELDGKFGRKTAHALRDFVQANPEAAEKIDPAMKKMMTANLEKGAASHLFNHLSKPEIASPKSELPKTTPEGKTLLHPDLVEQMKEHKLIRQYVETTQKAAEAYGLDGNLLANQLRKESFKLYDPENGRTKDPARLVSHVGAVGVGQIMPGTAREYGITNPKELLDPNKSIETSARYVRDIMDKHGVNQEVALIGYNAGPRRIEDLQKWAGKREVTVNDFIDKMEEERADKGITFKSGPRKGHVNYNLVRVQTYDYVREIVPSQWDEKTLKRALDKPENQIGTKEPDAKPDNGPTYVDGKPGLTRFAQSEIEIRAANKNDQLSHSFGRAADLIQIADLGGNTPPTKPKGPELSSRTFDMNLSLS